MARPAEDWDPSDDELEELADEDDYAGEEHVERASRAPLIMGVIGIVCWFLCGVGAIASIILGIKGQRRARELGQSEVLCLVAWIGGIVVLVLFIIGLFYAPSTYQPDN